MRKIIFLILDFLGIAIISLLSFGIFPITDGLVISYVFLIVAALMQLVPVLASKKLNDTVYKASLYTTTGIYFVIQFVVSFLGYTFLSTSLVLIITMSAILLLLSIAVLIIVWKMGDIGDKTNKKEKTKVFFIDKAICTLEKVKTLAKENELITEIDYVIEKVRYSNLNSPEEAVQTELKIIEELENIEKHITASKARESKSSCEKLITLFAEREMLCKLYK